LQYNTKVKHELKTHPQCYNINTKQRCMANKEGLNTQTTLEETHLWR